MISEKLQKAREFEQEQLSKISPEERPSFSCDWWHRLDQ